MGMIRAACILVTIMVVSTSVCLIRSFDLWTAMHIGCICVAVFGIVCGIIGAYKSRCGITHERPLDDEAFIKLLVNDIKKARRTIHIVEGDENIELYNDPRVKNAFEKACERGVKIQFVLKPSAY